MKTEGSPMLSATLQSDAMKISDSDFQADPAHPGQDFFILTGGEAERSGNRRAANPQFVQSELDDCRIGAKPAHHRNQRRFFCISTAAVMSPLINAL